MPFFNNLKEHMNMSDFSILQTDEICHLNNIGPLNLTHLRVRSMFIFKNLLKIFEFCKINKTSFLNIFSIITNKKIFHLESIFFKY